MALLEKVNCISDLKKLSIEELVVLASEIRDYLINSVTVTGGHLASNLGAVELTIALHYVFDSPDDKIIWDVGHQSYVHKILTGRKDLIRSIRSKGGLSGFPNTNESEHDIFNTGHSSTSLSLGLGFARARDLEGQDNHVISVIGDGALTGGMAFEALNDLGSSKTKMIVILNDNNMSISPNVGGMSQHLSKVRLSRKYAAFKLRTLKLTRQLPLIGNKIAKVLERVRDNLKFALVGGKMFEQLGLKYIGAIDGHNIMLLVEFFEHVKRLNEPVLMHISTVKGKGMPEAERNPSKYHGVNPCGYNGSEYSFSKTLGCALTANAYNNPKIIAITAAMEDGTGLTPFREAHGDRFFDVAICEQHAVTMAAAFAKSGFKPYFAVYSSFLQRSYDQLLHDVCLNKLGVVLCIDRAGVVGADGITHQGIYDLSYLSTLPNITICVPKSTEELKAVLKWSETYNAPLAIRYPRDSVWEDGKVEPVREGKWEIISAVEGKSSQSNCVILAAGGRMLDIASKAMELIKGKISVTLVNARFVKPIDREFLDEAVTANALVVVMEDNIAHGGLMSAVGMYLNSKLKAVRYEHICMPDTVSELGSIDEVFEAVGITPQTVAARINKRL